MNGKRRYKLTIITENENVDVIIPNALDCLNHLSDIDLFTIHFESEKALVNYFKYVLQEKGLDSSQALHVSITYKSGGTEKQMRIIYKDKNVIEEYAEVGSSNIPSAKTNQFYDLFMKNIINGKFYRHLKDLNLINSRLNFMLEEYLYNGVSIYEEKIKTEISRYKVARGLIIGVLSYEKKYNHQLIRKTPIAKKEDQNMTINVQTGDEYLDYLLSIGDVNQVMNSFSLETLDSYGVLNLVTNTKQSVKTKTKGSL